MRQQDLGAAERYWREQLRGFTVATQLGIEEVGAVKQAESYAEQELWLEQSISERLEQLGREQQVTLNTIVQGAWGVLLSRYSGERDVVFGATVSGRPAELAGVATMVGLFINTLPVRVRVNGEQAVGDWLRQLQQEQFEARQYEYSPLVAVQGWSEVPPGEPLFESLFVFENYPMEVSMKQFGGTGEKKQERGRDRGLRVSRARVTEQVNYPLSVIAGAAQEICIRISYDQQRFAGEAIERMLSHLEVLLQGIAANSAGEVSRLPLLSAAERRQVVEKWNESEADYGEWRSVVAEFEEQVQRRGSEIALTAGEVEVSYAELNERANQLARYLRRAGVSSEARVGLCLERSVELVIGIWGILKAGAAYVPLEPDYPPERLSFMVQDAAISVVLTQRLLSDALAQCTVQQVYLDEQWQQISHESASAIEVELWPENPAYVIYTSGSTGKPKGAMNTHRAISNRLHWMQEVYQLTTDDRVLQKTPFSFDVSVWEFLWPLMVGARLILARPGGHQDSAYLVNLIAEQQVTTMHFVPSMLQLFLDEPRLNECQHLRRVICSGEALPIALQEKFEERLAVELHNLYGPTEAAIDVTFWKCELGDKRRSVPIGRPIANTQIYLLDQTEEAVPIGVAGELHIGGASLARGYVNGPALTAEKFIANPFSVAGERLYKTGDLARYLPDGNIEFLGRMDHQVKIRGFRIELGEVEAALRQHPQVNEAVVVAREGKNGLNRLIGYIASKLPEDQSLTVSELRNYLNTKLPDYMVPSAFVMMEKFPLLANGKLDRKALPAPDKTLSPDDPLRIGNPFVAPRDPLETQLQKIYEEILDVSPIGVFDNFFTLGGNSLLVIRLTARIYSHIGQELPLATIFDNPTIDKLAKMVREREWPNVLQLVDKLPPIKSPLVSIKPTGTQRPFFYVAPLGGVLPGNVLGGILELADYLDEDQPYYGLQLPGLAQELACHLSADQPLNREGLRAVFVRLMEERAPQQIIADSAAQCVRAMRSVQPEGPYLVGGFRSGGIIAAATALQLIKEGHEVAVLAIVDAEAPHSGPRHEEVSFFDHLAPIVDTTDESLPLDERDIASIAGFIGRHLTGNHLAKDLPVLQDDLRRLSPKERWAYAAEQVKTVAGKGSFEPQEIQRLYLIDQINLHTTSYILSNYRMPIYPGRMLLFPTESGVATSHVTDPILGWSQFSFQPVDVYQIPGTLFLPQNVKVLAEQLTQCFDEAQRIESSEREERSGAREANMAAFVDRKVSLEHGEYHYRVYVPANYTADKKWPLIFFFHGEGEGGKDGISQTQMGLGAAIRRHPAQYPCLVLMPQCLEKRSWGDPEMEMQAFAALQQTVDEFNVDEERIYLNGISSGGNASWYFGAKYPGKFAAIVPMGGASPLPGLSDEQYAAIAASIKQTPIWLFHGQADPIIDVAETRKLVEILRSVKANIRYTEYEGVGHGAWELAYEEPDLIPWLLSQRRTT
jgi:amino acid adenylation domain-containing protein